MPTGDAEAEFWVGYGRVALSAAVFGGSTWESCRSFHARQAEALAAAAGDQTLLGRVLTGIAHQFRVIGDERKTVEFAGRAREIARATGDEMLEMSADMVLAAGFHQLGDYRRGAEAAERNIARATGERPRLRVGAGLISVMSRVWGSWSWAELGEFTRGESRACEAVQIAVDADNRAGHVLALWALGLLELCRGDAAAAALALGEGLRLAEAGAPPVRHL